MKGPEIIKVSLQVGSLLLANGAETCRVEESIERICKACGVKEVHVFAVLSTIIVTIVMEDDYPITQTSRIHKRNIELHKVECLNNLSRRICYETMSYEQIMAEVHRIDAFPSYHKVLIFFCYGLVASLFSLFFGGSLLNASVAFCAGLLVKLGLNAMSQLSVNSFFTAIIGGIIASITPLISSSFGLPIDKDTIIIGAIMTLVPGLAITNAIRDIIAGDFLSGITRGIEAILIGLGIAIGVAVSLSLFKFLGGV